MFPTMKCLVTFFLAAMAASGFAATHKALERIELAVAGETVVIEAGAPVEVISISGAQAYLKVLLPSGKNSVAAVALDKLEKPERQAPPHVVGKVESSPAPQEEATGTVAVPPPASSRQATFAGKPIALGSRNQLTAVLPPEFQKQRKKLKLADDAVLNIGLTVPRDFDPTKDYPVIVVAITDDSKETDIAAMWGFEFMAQEGWVVLAAAGSAKAVSAVERAVSVLAALHALESEWPGVKSWSFAVGGYSGGAKAAGFLAPAILGDGRELIGVYMSGSNSATPTMAGEYIKDVRKFSERDYKRVPIFLSNGSTDGIAGPREQKKVADLLEDGGFKQVRSEIFEGGHEDNKEHTTLALRWFLELRKEGK
jgi:hypothetical protein